MVLPFVPKATTPRRKGPSPRGGVEYGAGSPGPFRLPSAGDCCVGSPASSLFPTALFHPHLQWVPEALFRHEGSMALVFSRSCPCLGDIHSVQAPSAGDAGRQQDGGVLPSPGLGWSGPQESLPSSLWPSWAGVRKVRAFFGERNGKEIRRVGPASLTSSFPGSG